MGKLSDNAMAKNKTLWIIGNGKGRGALENSVIRLGISEVVEFEKRFKKEYESESHQLLRGGLLRQGEQEV